jgi:hypothetical protein
VPYELNSGVGQLSDRYQSSDGLPSSVASYSELSISVTLTAIRSGKFACTFRTHVPSQREQHAGQAQREQSDTTRAPRAACSIHFITSGQCHTLIGG